jgi:hypothetical protein
MDYCSVEMSYFLQKPGILEQCRVSRSKGHAVMAVRNRSIIPHGQFVVCHKNHLSFLKMQSLYVIIVHMIIICIQSEKKLVSFSLYTPGICQRNQDDTL